MKSEWSNIVKYSDLRNSLVHSDVISLDGERLKNIKKIRHINFEETEGETQVSISSNKMLIVFIGFIDDFLSKLYFE